MEHERVWTKRKDGVIMIHFVYETTNLINGKKYIGKHSTTNIDDGYLGSGKILLEDIKMYGRKNFGRKILIIVGSEEESYRYENKLITNHIIQSKKYYNLTVGGQGFNSDDLKKQWKDPEFKKKMSKANSKSIKRTWENDEYRKIKTVQSKNQMEKQWKNPEFVENMKKMWGSPEFKKKMSNQLKKQWKNPEFVDMQSKRMSKMNKGENNPNAKFTNENIIDIKKRLQRGEKGIDIAKIYNVNRCVIYNIKNDKRWKHITI